MYGVPVMGKALLEMQGGVGCNPSSPGGWLIMRRDHSEMGSLQLVPQQHPQGLEPSPLIGPGRGGLAPPTKAELGRRAGATSHHYSSPALAQCLLGLQLQIPQPFSQKDKSQCSERIIIFESYTQNLHLGSTTLSL